MEENEWLPGGFLAEEGMEEAPVYPGLSTLDLELEEEEEKEDKKEKNEERGAEAGDTAVVAWEQRGPSGHVLNRGQGWPVLVQCSPPAALGAALCGKRPGDTFLWERFSGTVTEIVKPKTDLKQMAEAREQEAIRLLQRAGLHLKDTTDQDEMDNAWPLLEQAIMTILAVPITERQKTERLRAQVMNRASEYFQASGSLFMSARLMMRELPVAQQENRAEVMLLTAQIALRSGMREFAEKLIAGVEKVAMPTYLESTLKKVKEDFAQLKTHQAL